MSTTPGRRVSSASWTLLLAGAAAIAVASAIVYYPALNGNFVLDDNLLLTDNPLVKAPDGFLRIWNILQAHNAWPMTNASFWIEWRLWGTNPLGYHLTNLVLHCTTAVMVWESLRRLRIPGAFLAALIFAVHPVNVQSVAWIAQRKNLLAMLFLLASILWFLKSEERQTTTSRWSDRWYWLSLVSFVAAMLSKGSVAVLPLILAGVICWQRTPTSRDVARLLPFLLISAALVPLNIWFQSRGMNMPAQPLSPVARLQGSAAVVWFYLSKALCPLRLAFIYPKWRIEPQALRWWLPLAASVAVTAVLWIARRRWSRPLLFAWAFYCTALLPVMGFTDTVFMVEQSLVADHYQHLAIIAVAAGLGAGWKLLQGLIDRRYRWLSYSMAIAAVAGLASLARQQSALYSGNIGLFRDAVEKYPDSAMAYNDLGFVLLQAGRPQAAAAELQHAVQLEPDYVEAYNNLGAALAQSGQIEAAIEQFEGVLRLQPDHAGAHNNLGALLRENGRPQESITHFTEALRLKPDFPEAHRNLGKALLQVGRPGPAVEHLQAALNLRPEDQDTRSGLQAAVAQRDASGPQH